MRKEEVEYNIHLRNILLGKEKGILTGKPNLDKPHLKFYPEEALLDELPQNTMYGYLCEQNKAHMSDIAIVLMQLVVKRKLPIKSCSIILKEWRAT